MSMQFVEYQSEHYEQVVDCIYRAFADSEGEDEGRTIRALVENLVSTTPMNDLLGFCAVDKGDVRGAIFFSRFFLESSLNAFMLSPVAVVTRHQGQGIGQKLIRYGLNEMQSNDVQLVLTYGSPDYYGKFGFKNISEHTISPPYPLAHPIGWLAQRLDGQALLPIKGKTQCVEAFNNPLYW